MASHTTADWMANLPQALKELPLSKICIPGSHDTGSYYLDQKGPMASDAPEFVQHISCLPGTKRVAANWGLTQSLNFTQQLEAGLRYFDLRVAVNPGDEKLYLVHTLYGPQVEDMLSAVDEFLRLHSGEVVFLDFNHFYNMTEKDHKFLLSRLLTVFGTRLCAVDYPVAGMTLKQMISQGKQVIVFYQFNTSVPEKWQVASRASISSPWPNTPVAARCVEILKAVFEKPPAVDFVVCQGVLTPSIGTVIGDLCGSLRKLNQTLSPLLVPWLEETTDHLNIVIGDFVEEADFIETVLQRNLRAFTVKENTGLKLLW